MENNRIKDKLIQCPLANEKVDIGFCVVTQDVVDNMLKERVLPEKYRQKHKWKEICKNCQYYGL